MHDHSHTHVHTEDARRLTIALALILGLMAGEVVAGLVADSLALLSDAAHMLTDAAAIGLALFAARIARRPAEGRFTFGFRRAEILSAQLNGATLVALALVIAIEAVRRLINPPEVEGLIVLIVALVGIVVNLAATMVLSGAERRSLNVEGAFQYVLTDLFAFIATAIAGAVVLITGVGRADGIAALVVAGLMLRSGLGLLRDSGRVLLEAAPEGMSVSEIGLAIAEHPNVANVHDLHVWTIGSGFPALSAHVLVHPGDDCHAIRRELELLIARRFGIEHTTLQVDHESERQLLTLGRS